MSKAVTSVDYCAGILLDCGHKTFIRMSESPSRGDEVDCPVCAEIAEREDAARREALKEVENMMLEAGDYKFARLGLDKLLEVKDGD